MVPGIKRGFTHSSVHRGLIIINYDFLNGGWQSKFFFAMHDRRYLVWSDAAAA